MDLIIVHEKLQLNVLKKRLKCFKRVWEEGRLDLEKIEVSLHLYWQINQTSVPNSSIALFLPLEVLFSLLHPYSVHLCFLNFHSQSPRFSPDMRPNEDSASDRLMS